jgi:hypothetical protein
MCDVDTQRNLAQQQVAHLWVRSHPYQSGEHPAQCQLVFVNDSHGRLLFQADVRCCSSSRVW